MFRSSARAGVAGLAAACLVATAPALVAQAPTGLRPYAADVVVAAEAAPEPAASLGVAATVIDAAEIARTKATTLVDLLRAVPGLDVVQSGGPGGVTSLFLRGTSSTQTLVLVDGVPLNSPYFGGTDLSALSTANVERVEIVRGPFSALYGSEAIGGVVEIFTKRSADPGVSGHASFALGNAGGKEGSLEGGFSEGALSATIGFRRTLSSGEKFNEFFSGTTLSGALTAALGDGASLGVSVRRETGRTGVPTDGATPTPQRWTKNDTATVEVPLSLPLSRNLSLEASVRYARDTPQFGDPDSFFSSSSTDARRAGGRVTASLAWGPNRLAAGVDYERTQVTTESNLGVALDGATSRTFAVFAEDRIALWGERLVATAGVRWDDASAYGSAVSPRVTVAWRALPGLKVRAAAGSAFRAPSLGELYYPYSGNPDLRPEKSAGWEIGLEQTLAGGVVGEVTAFWNDIRDLIQYDAQAFSNTNVGRARTRGVEVAARTAVGGLAFLRASYTYLDAKDLDAGTALIRRPRHRASLTAGSGFGAGGSWSVTGLFTGARPDRDAADFTTLVESPSYVRVDAAVTLPPVLFSLSPWARVTNLFGRTYAEVNGFPAPGRRLLAGLEASF
jgi:vitamin B12 transporter